MKDLYKCLYGYQWSNTCFYWWWGVVIIKYGESSWKWYHWIKEKPRRMEVYFLLRLRMVKGWMEDGWMEDIDRWRCVMLVVSGCVCVAITALFSDPSILTSHHPASIHLYIVAPSIHPASCLHSPTTCMSIAAMFIMPTIHCHSTWTLFYMAFIAIIN